MRKGYRFGFQGQESDDEVKGEGNSIFFKYRVHDPRIGRFLSIDPLAPDYPWNSPYAFSENRVIDGVELEGLEYMPVSDIPGEVFDAFVTMGGVAVDLVKETVVGAYNLITDPVETSGEIIEGASQIASDVGTIYGTFGQNLYSTVIHGKGAEIDEDAFYGAIYRQSNNIVDGAIGGGVGLAAGGVIRMLPTPEPMPGVVTNGFSFSGFNWAKIRLGSTDLSKMTMNARKRSGPNSGKNFATIEYKDLNGDIQYKSFESSGTGAKSGHTEVLIQNFFNENNIPYSNLKRLHSELVPCASCTEVLMHMDTKNVTYDFDRSSPSMADRNTYIESN